jgi:hypothetical protein
VGVFRIVALHHHPFPLHTISANIFGASISEATMGGSGRTAPAHDEAVALAEERDLVHEGARAVVPKRKSYRVGPKFQVGPIF